MNRYEDEAPTAQGGTVEDAFEQATKMRAIARDNAEALMQQRDQYLQMASECDAAANIWKVIAQTDVESVMEKEADPDEDDPSAPDPARMVSVRKPRTNARRRTSVNSGN